MNKKAILQYCIRITDELKSRINKLFLSSESISREVQIGADGEPTTYIDKFAEDFIIKKLKSKDRCTIMSEEMGVKNFGNKELLFVVDPIDGTSNAKVKLPFFTCSIGSYYKKEPLFGVVRDLYNGDLFYGIAGSGAYLNKRRIYMKNKFILKESVITCGRPLCSEDIKLYEKINFSTKANRIIACPSLEICYAASGKTDWCLQVHKNPGAKIMDVAAAIIILKEAGGILIHPTGKPIDLVLDTKFKFNFIGCKNDEKILRQIISLIEKNTG